MVEWHKQMATIFEFICCHMHVLVAGLLWKWQKWTIGSTSAASLAIWHVGWCPEKSRQLADPWILRLTWKKRYWIWINPVSGKYGTGLRLFIGLTSLAILQLRPIKRIVLFPVHLKLFSWVGRKVFLFFILYSFACKIHGVRGKNSDF